MRKIYLAALLASSLLGACGGGGDASAGASRPPEPAKTAPVDPVDAVAKARFGVQVSFGDSLSDVGTYAVGTVQALGGGKFTINGDNTAVSPTLTGQNWTEVLAAKFKLPVPCAAQTGLDGEASQGFSVPVVDHAGCFGYAQGGARVTNPVGPSHKLTGSALGALTVPVGTQIERHLARSGGKFKSDDVVLVMAGGNDLLLQLGALSAAAEAAGNAASRPAFISSLVALLAAGAADPTEAAVAITLAISTESGRPGSTLATITQAAVSAAAVQPGNGSVTSPAVYGPMVSKATVDATAAGNAAGAEYASANSPSLVNAMATAGEELGTLVKAYIVAKGAQFVVVNNLPDVAGTPAGHAATQQIRDLMTAMAQAFNSQLHRVVSGDTKVLLVDVYALSQDAAAHPDAYGLTNVTEPACDLTPARNPLESSLACNGANLKAGDVSHYAYADDVHPTPYYYALLAKHVAEKMALRGWL